MPKCTNELSGSVMDAQFVLTQHVASFLSWAELGRWKCTSRRARARVNGIVCAPVPWSRLAQLFRDPHNTYFVWVFQDAAGVRWCIEMTIRRAWAARAARASVHVWCSAQISLACERSLRAHVQPRRSVPRPSLTEFVGTLRDASDEVATARGVAALAAALGIDASSSVDTNCGISDWIRARMHAEFARDDVFFRTRQLVRLERTATCLRRRPRANMPPAIRVCVPDYIRPNAVSDAVDMYGDRRMFLHGHMLAGWTPMGCPIVLLRTADAAGAPVVHVKTAEASLPPVVFRRLCDAAATFFMVRTAVTATEWTFAGPRVHATMSTSPCEAPVPKCIAFLPDRTVPIPRLLQLLFHAINLRDVGGGLNIVETTPTPVLRNVLSFMTICPLPVRPSYKHLFQTPVLKPNPLKRARSETRNA